MAQEGCRQRGWGKGARRKFFWEWKRKWTSLVHSGGLILGVVLGFRAELERGAGRFLTQRRPEEQRRQKKPRKRRMTRTRPGSSESSVSISAGKVPVPPSNKTG